MNKLAVLLCPIVALTGCMSVASAGTGRAVERSHQSVAASGIAALRVENVSGDVTVSAGSGGSITIDAVKRGQDDAALGRTHVEVSHDGSTLRVRTKYDRTGFNNNGASVDYTIHVPANLDVNVGNVSGDITLTGLKGDVRADDVSGDVDAALGTVGGSRTVFMKAVSGTIHVAVARNSSFNVEANTISGDIQAFFPADTHKGFVGERLSGNLGSGKAKMTLGTVSGSISVTAQ